MKIFLLGVLLVGFACATSEKSLEKDFITANMNDYVDKAIPNIVQFLVNNGMDPMQLPDLIESFSAKPLWITYHGKLELTKGSAKNLRSLRRAGDVKASYNAKIFKFSGDIGVNNIEVNYDYVAKIMNIGPRGGLKASVEKANLFFEILVDFNNNEVHLLNFYIHDVGKISAKLTGNVLTDWLVNGIIKVVVPLVKNVILNMVEVNLKRELQNFINDLNNSIGQSKSYLDEMRTLIAPKVYARNQVMLMN